MTFERNVKGLLGTKLGMRRAMHKLPMKCKFVTREGAI